MITKEDMGILIVLAFVYILVAVALGAAFYFGPHIE